MRTTENLFKKNSARNYHVYRLINNNHWIREDATNKNTTRKQLKTKWYLNLANFRHKTIFQFIPHIHQIIIISTAH